MKYGVCTWTFGNQTLVETANFLSEIGYDGVELMGDLSLYSAQEAKSILDDAGLEVLSLTPADADIAHPDDTIRANAVDYYYRLLDFASELGNPLVSCHGLVTRIKPIESQQAEDLLLRHSVMQIVERAAQAELQVVFEVLNRYETHQIHTHMQALQLVRDINADNFGVLLDAYHMNIEEANPTEALRNTDDKLWLYHVADSNRAGVGHGHIDFAGQYKALADIHYSNPVIVECTASGANPFTPEKGSGWRDQHKQYLKDSLTRLKELETN